jgi:hypothetical protein
MTDSADVQNLKNYLEHERTMESNVNDVYTDRLGRIYAAFRGVAELEARVAELTAANLQLARELADTEMQLARADLIIMRYEDE